MKGIVDRIEGDILVLEIRGEYINVDINLFPDTIKEGDLVVKEGDNYRVLVEETKERTKNMDDLLRSLFDESED